MYPKDLDSSDNEEDSSLYKNKKKGWLGKKEKSKDKGNRKPKKNNLLIIPMIE